MSEAENKKEEETESANSEGDDPFDQKDIVHKMPTTVDVFEDGRKYWKMLFYSNTFVNVIFVTSYLCPRHVRVSMLYANLILLWFLVAVFYNNTKDPLVVPNFESSARNLAMNEIWIALAAPLVSMLISYIFWGVYRVSDKRFHQSDAYERLMEGKLMKALFKEMYLRFVIAYFIVVSTFSAPFVSNFLSIDCNFLCSSLVHYNIHCQIRLESILDVVVQWLICVLIQLSLL